MLANSIPAFVKGESGEVVSLSFNTLEPPKSFAVDPQYSSSIQRMRKGFTPGLHGCLSANRIIFSIVYKSVTVDALLINRIAGSQESLYMLFFKIQ